MWSEEATKTRQRDLLRPTLGQKEPPRTDRTICFGRHLVRKSYKTRQHDSLRPTFGQKEPGTDSTICCSRRMVKMSHPDPARHLVTKSQKNAPVRFLQPTLGQKEQPNFGSTICYGRHLLRRSQKQSAMRLFAGDVWSKPRRYDLLRPSFRVGEKGRRSGQGVQPCRP